MKILGALLLFLFCSSGCTVYVHHEPYPYGGYGGGYGGHGYRYPRTYDMRPYGYGGRTYYNFYGSWGWSGSSWRGGRRHHHRHHHHHN